MDRLRRAMTGTVIQLTEIFDQLSQLDLTPLVLALLLSGIIGLEREVHGRPAGMRTHMLVCLSSTVLILSSRALPDLAGKAGAAIVFDPQRLAAGIVTGIGFLGAGAIVRSGDIVRGVTTGACIWCVAGLGVAIGQHAYGLAIGATGVYLVVLVLLDRLPRRLGSVVYRSLHVHGSATDIPKIVGDVRGVLQRHKVRVQEVTGGLRASDCRFELVFHIRCRNTMEAPVVLVDVTAVRDVESADWTTPNP